MSRDRCHSADQQERGANVINVPLAYFHERPLHNQFGISHQLEQQLQRIQINTMSDLLKVGAVDAYLRLQKLNGGKLRVSYLYAFAGAIAGKHWFEFSKEEKADLRLKAGLDRSR